MGTPPFRVKAVFDYSSPHDDDLSFSNGQIVLVTDEEDADWYYGEYQDSGGKKQEGLFPKNFVEKYEPETPPRPSRPTRPKKDIEQAQGPSNPPDTDIPVEDTSPSAHATNSPPSKPTVQESVASGGPKVEEHQPMSLPPTLPNPSAAPPLSSSVKGVNKPGTPMGSKAAPPAVAEKPSGGSFRDRIAAFNKPAAPVAPIKPSGLGQPGALGFVKKPFVAPPPSKNAYVPPPREPPPQKVYRREEDPEIVPASNDQARPSLPVAPTPSASVDADLEDQPKPTSLKERIALLQKQQMEQAARHGEGGQKKEKPKRPPKKRTESHQSEKNLEGGTSTQQVESLERKSTEDDTPSHGPPPRARSSTRRRKSKEVTPATSPNITSHEMFSDANDADQSAAGDTEQGDVSTGKDDDKKFHRRTSVLPPRTRKTNIDQSSAGKDDDSNKQESEEERDEEDDEEEEEEVDPEVRRRMEIRERMAKMSGGMGMAGMFGPPPGVPPIASKKQMSGGGKPRDSETGNDATTGGPPSSRGVPLMGLPGMQRVRSPEQEHAPVEVPKEQMSTPNSLTQDHEPEDIPDIEDVEEEPRPTTRRPEERPVPLPPPESFRAQPLPPMPPSRAVPPPIPSDRPAPPPPPTESRHVAPALPSNMPLSPSTGSEFDDDMVSDTKSLSIKTDMDDDARPSGRAPPPIPSAGPSPMVPNRPQDPRSPTSQYSGDSFGASQSPRSPTMPIAASTSAKRASRVPPVPTTAATTSLPPQSRAPPPPPPSQAPPSRSSMAGPPSYLATPNQDSEEEVSEYDGDYDTDIAPTASHKEALRSHAKEPSLDEPLTGDEASYHHPGLPSLGPPPLPGMAPPRAGPPLPPNQPPKNTRSSSDMPRSAPPPPPLTKEQLEEEPEEYDPYSYVSPKQPTSLLPPSRQEGGPKLEEHYDDSYSMSQSPNLVSSPSIPAPQSYASSPISPPERSIPRQSLDVLKHVPSTRRSMDASRPSVEQGFIANDVDLGKTSQWWTKRKMPPPVFQNRSDVIYEIEETKSNQQEGPQVTIRNVYVLYMDYSQSVITARFETLDPLKVELQQHHEPPPGRLRQDQLESAHSSFGVRIAEAATTRQNSVVGDGAPFILVLDILKALPDALMPVGSRAYGALVYANLANASVQQNDEIRAGDIVSFRNVKLQGHKGPMKQKYNMEVGKPDHVGIVVDWDGTKKKVRAWEQGRESKKVKIESFKLGDLRSGEVKVWRVMQKSWVGWGGQS